MSTELQSACTKFTCANTKKNNTWATKVFDDWLSGRNKTAQQTFPNVLRTMQSRLTIDRVLSAFVLESRRKDGKSYPPNTLRNILAALFRVMKETFGPGNILSFMDNKVRERDYPLLHNAMDRHFRHLRSVGVGIERKQASVITLEQHTCHRFCYKPFFYNGKNFCLRGQKEYINLALSQVVRGTNPDRYTYYEHGSKNHTGGVVDQTAGKVVTIVDTGGPFSYVALLDLYLNKRPTADLDNTNPQSPFYLSPYPFTPLSGLWYFPERYFKLHVTRYAYGQCQFLSYGHIKF